MHSLSTLLHVALPWLSPVGQATIELLVRQRGYFESAAAVALALRLKNRHQLGRELRQDALPSLEELATWIRMLVWLKEWEATGTALSRRVLSEARDPAPCYRTVKTFTDLSWSEWRSRGSDYLLLAFVERCEELRRSALTQQAGTYQEFCVWAILRP
jgi:hypothetical protein